jgi:beta-aspartyl-peptidase (threonine type)
MIAFALHGGAGEAARPRPDDADYRAALGRIAEAGIAALRAGAAALDVVEQTVAALEDCPLFNAGVGAVLTAAGSPELDAAIMDGRSRRAGAVAAVQRAKNPVRLARAILEGSPHLFFAGPAAEALCAGFGLETVAPHHFVTETRQRQLERARAATAVALDHDHDDAAFGTVGCVARDQRGHLAAATSTGGLTNKAPGRIGDTPVIGAGTYADDRSVAVSCTGTGESFIRACAAHQLHARLLWGREPLEAAARAVLEDVAAVGGRGGLIAVSAQGEVALPFSTSAMYRAWLDGGGTLRVAIREAE